MKPIKYIIENERDLLWGLSINTVGYEHIKKGEKYMLTKEYESMIKLHTHTHTHTTAINK